MFRREAIIGPTIVFGMGSRCGAVGYSAPDGFVALPLMGGSG
jgi:hypothetical protein